MVLVLLKYYLHECFTIWLATAVLILRFNIFTYLITYPVALSRRGADESLTIFLNFFLSVAAQIFYQIYLHNENIFV